MDTFFPSGQNGGRRRTPAEIIAWVREKHGLRLVAGYRRVLDASRATENRGRIATFLELGRGVAWYVNQKNGALVWETETVPTDLDPAGPDVVFIFSMGVGNGSALPQPTGQFDLTVNDQLVASSRVSKHSESWRRPDGQASFRFEVRRLETAPPWTALVLDDVLQQESFAAFGQGFVRVPARWLQPGAPARIGVVGLNPAPETKRWFKLDNADRLIGWSNPWSGLAAIAAGRTTPTIDEWNVYFGDIHTHSGYSVPPYGACGVGSLDDNYRYARDVSNLDYYALTDHDWQIMPRTWREELMARAEEYNAPGRFATLPAFEWTSSMYGHRNVYYLDPEQPLYLSRSEATLKDYWSTDADSPTELWRKLEQLRTQALTIPHHPTAGSHPLTWDYWDAQFDRLVEIYSSWGSSEYPYNRYRGENSDRYPDLTVRRALDRGHRLGFIASSDSHDGHPGNAQSPGGKHHHIFHHLGSGRAVVLARDLSRHAVFEALAQRRCYATTGEPIILDVRMALPGAGRAIMGSEVRLSRAGGVEIQSRVIACAPLERIDVIKNGRLVHAESYIEEAYEAELTWGDARPTPGSYYYVRVVQRDGEMAWSSPIWLE